MVIIGPILLLVAVMITIVKQCKKQKAIQYQIDLQVAEKNLALQNSAQSQLYGAIVPQGFASAVGTAGIYAPPHEPYTTQLNHSNVV